MSLQVPPLMPANYVSWAIKVEVILNAQGLWCAVAPAEGDAVDAGKRKTARVAMLGALLEDLLMRRSQPRRRYGTPSRFASSALIECGRRGSRLSEVSSTACGWRTTTTLMRTQVR